MDIHTREQTSRLDSMSIKSFSLKNNMSSFNHINKRSGSPTQSGITSMAFIDGNRNFCHKHKKKYVNFCLDHGVPLCATCFKDH
jgi:hypothetical protein